MGKKDSNKHQDQCLECGSEEGCEHCLEGGEVELVDVAELLPPAQVSGMGEPPAVFARTLGEPDTLKMVEPATKRELKMVDEEPPEDNREEPPQHGQTAVKYGQILREQGHKRRKYFGTVKRR